MRETHFAAGNNEGTECAKGSPRWITRYIDVHAQKRGSRMVTDLARITFQLGAHRLQHAFGMVAARSRPSHACFYSTTRRREEEAAL